MDTHAHLQDQVFRPDQGSVIKRAFTAGVHQIIIVGYDYLSSQEAVALAARQERVFAAVGIHPHDAAAWQEDTGLLLSALGRRKKVVAIGEIGLDYYRDLSPREIQKKVFAAQLEVARKISLPVIIHSRDAGDEILGFIKDFPGLTGVVHCFSGTLLAARKLIEMGWYIGITGAVTFPKAATLHEVVRSVPLERLLLETDAPYLAPQSHRGQRNEPGYLGEIATAIAALKNIEVSVVAEQTTANAKKLFKF
ncbi:MAG: TatD family hydrolase [bacterium]|nr:TatD family hydrolase [bacterium]